MAMTRWSWPRTRFVVMPLLVAVLAATVFLLRPPGGNRPRPAELEAFSDGLAPIVQSWGSVEILGMRMAIGDLRDGEETGIPAMAIAAEARAWQASFAQNREDLDALGVPRGLEEVVRLLHASLDRYVAAAEAFGLAARTVADGGALDLDAGISAAAEGAELFDRAAVLFQQIRRSAGLAPDPTFPTEDQDDVVD